MLSSISSGLQSVFQRAETKIQNVLDEVETKIETVATQ